MLTAGKDPFPSHTEVKQRRILDHLLGCRTIAAPFERVVRIVIKRDIQHRAKIEVETKHPQNLPS